MNFLIAKSLQVITAPKSPPKEPEEEIPGSCDLFLDVNGEIRRITIDSSWVLLACWVLDPDRPDSVRDFSRSVEAVMAEKGCGYARAVDYAFETIDRDIESNQRIYAVMQDDEKWDATIRRTEDDQGAKEHQWRTAHNDWREAPLPASLD